jgi:Flp pilus assembly pilin Flp
MLRHFFRDESGAMLAEYALIVGLGGVGCVCVLYYFGDAISGALKHVGDMIALGWSRQ